MLRLSIAFAVLMVIPAWAPRAQSVREQCLFGPSSSTASELTIAPLMLSSAPTEPGAGEQESEKLAKLAQNPVANLISIPFQNNMNFGYGPKNVMQDILNIQPVIPFPLNSEWNLITRTIVPVVNQQSPAEGVSSVFGMGDINPTFFLSPANPGKWIWGIGPAMTFPTGTDPALTSGQFSLGPAAVVLQINGHWVYGCLVSQQWSVFGWRDQYVNGTVIQPFINYNLPHGWYVTSSPLITANWHERGDDVWTVPVGGGIGKIIKLGGKLPINLQCQAFSNVVAPDNGPDWQLRFQLQLLLPR